MSSPVRFDVVSPPAAFERVQLLLRLLIMIVLAVVGAPLGWVFGVLYFGLPALAAVTISQRGGSRYRDEMGQRLVSAFRWVLAVYAYLGLLTDRLPTSASEMGITFEVAPSGEPTVKSALWRLLSSLPCAIVMWLLGLVSALVWVIAAIFILSGGSYPHALYDFQRGIMRMFARFLASHASLVDSPAPIAFDTGAEATEAHA